MAEVYGTPWLETARDLITALITTLMASMASDDPTFSYIYEGHDRAMKMNAVSVDLDEVVVEDQDAARDQVLYLMQFSIRVHTAYNGGLMDGQKNARLLNSLTEKIKDNNSLGLVSGNKYFITQVTALTGREEFGGSGTQGGQLMCIVQASIIHTQE